MRLGLKGSNMMMTVVSLSRLRRCVEFLMVGVLRIYELAFQFVNEATAVFLISFCLPNSSGSTENDHITGIQIVEDSLHGQRGCSDSLETSDQNYT